jgi:hypothetical protein
MRCYSENGDELSGDTCNSRVNCIFIWEIPYHAHLAAKSYLSGKILLTDLSVKIFFQKATILQQYIKCTPYVFEQQNLTSTSIILVKHVRLLKCCEISSFTIDMLCLWDHIIYTGRLTLEMRHCRFLSQLV